MKQPNRVVHMSSVHSEDDSRIFYKQCQALTEKYEVYYVVPARADHEVAGVKIRAVELAPGRLRRLLFTGFKVYQKAYTLNADIYHIHDAELLLYALLLRLRRKKVIYDAHEHLVHSLQNRRWLPRPFRFIFAILAGQLEKLFARLVTARVAATKPIAKRLGAATLVRNYAVTGEIKPGPAAWHKREMLISYAGSITRSRGALEMVRAVNFCKTPGIRLALGGHIAEIGLCDQIKAEDQANRVECLGWLGRKEIAALLARTRIGVVVLQSNKAYHEALPVKLFEYWAAGLPVVASNFLTWRELVKDKECALFVDQADSTAIADAVDWLCKNPEKAAAMGRAGRKLVEKYYSFESEKERLLVLYKQLLI